MDSGALGTSETCCEVVRRAHAPTTRHVHIPEGQQPGFDEPHVYVSKGIPRHNLHRFGKIHARARTGGGFFVYILRTPFTSTTLRKNQKEVCLPTRGFSFASTVRFSPRTLGLRLNLGPTFGFEGNKR